MPKYLHETKSQLVSETVVNSTSRVEISNLELENRALRAKVAELEDRLKRAREKALELADITSKLRSF